MSRWDWWWARRPWGCEGGESPPAVWLAAKLLVAAGAVGVARGGFDAPFLPFWEWLSWSTVAVVWPWALGALFWSGAIGVMFNLVPRVAMAAAGAAEVLDIVAGRVRFSNSELLPGLLLLGCALTRREDGRRWWLRRQLALVYGGAALNKLLQADWWNGRFFGHWVGEVLGLEWFVRWDAAWAGGAAVALGWLTMGWEAGLAVLAMRPAATRWFVVLGLGFHIGLLVFSGGVISWAFLFLMAVAFTALADEPAGGGVRWRWWWPWAAAGVVVALRGMRWWVAG